VAGEVKRWSGRRSDSGVEVEIGMIYPTLKELLILSVVIAELVGAGFLIKRRWTARNETVPLSVAVGLWIGMFLIYFSVVAIVTSIRTGELVARHGAPAPPEAIVEELDRAPQAPRPGELSAMADPRLQIITTLGWALLLWTIPATYFTWTIVTSLAARNVERIGPFSAKIEDPSEFAAARKLALRGDIDGAVSMYRTYRDNEVNALFEAVRLLKSEDRFAEASEVLKEIENRFHNRSRVWAEAAYQNARLLEGHLGQSREAEARLREILQRAPESRFAQLAGSDLARLQILHGVNWDDDDDDFPVPAPAKKPPKKSGAAATPAKNEAKPPLAEIPPPGPQPEPAPPAPADFVQPVPPQDPFFAAMERRRLKNASEEAAASENSGAAPKKKPAAKKKAPAQKKAPAKKKAAPSEAKAKPAAKKATKPAAKAKKPAAKKKPASGTS